MLLNCGVGEDSWESLGLQGDPISPSKVGQSWVFIGRSDVDAETPILCPPDAKSWLIWKDPDSGEDWGQEEKETTKDELVGWHHRLNGHGFEWTLGVGDGQGGLACCGSWGQKESDTTERLNWTVLNICVLCIVALFYYLARPCVTLPLLLLPAYTVPGDQLEWKFKVFLMSFLSMSPSLGIGLVCKIF